MSFMLFGALSGVAVVLVLVLAAMAAQQRTRERGDHLRPVPVEGEPLLLLPDRASVAQEERVMAAARRYAERRAWQVALDVAHVRSREESERELMDAARQYAERRAWQVAMQLARDRTRQ